MKKLFIALMTTLLAANAYATCAQSKTTGYMQVKGGKLVKQQIKKVECARFSQYTFKNGLELGVDMYGWSINGREAVEVAKLKGVPSGYSCYTVDENRRATLCVK